MIQKLEPRHFGPDSGFGGATFSDVIDKVNEIIDAMNGEHDPADIYSEDGRLIAKKDESEDERIRKWLVDYFSSIKETVWIHKDITCEQILSWLENQKEQKPVENTCGACCDDERFKIIAQAKKDIIEKTNIAENELSMELPLLDGILMRVWQVGWLNKKPAEWSEEDEKIIANLRSTLANISVRGLIKKETEQKYSAWLKSLRPGWKPTEEQMGALSWMLENARANIDFDPLKDLYEQLKQL